MDKISVDPYLFFKGECREALEFYQGIFGGKLEFQTYDEVPGDTPEGMKGMIMHGSLTDGDVKLMASDTEKASPKAAKITISLSGDDEAKLTKFFEGLSDDITPQFPLKKEFWGDTFGSLTDKYGVDWMVNINAKKEEEV